MIAFDWPLTPNKLHNHTMHTKEATSYSLTCCLMTDLGVRVAEDPLVGVLGQEGQETLLASATFRDVVFLHQGVVALERDGVEIQVKGGPAAKAEASDSIEPPAHESWVSGRRGFGYRPTQRKPRPTTLSCLTTQTIAATALRPDSRAVYLWNS
jgi:hypothetical protein